MTLTNSDIEALGRRAESMIFEMAKISAEPNRLIRLYLSPEHRRAADLTAKWMREVGLDVSEDALGTVRGQWRGPGVPDRANIQKRLYIGSHLDSVIDAGKYDGPLGVIAGILAVDYIARSGKRLPFAIDVLAFGDEEGSRFPSKLSTSAACAGKFEDSTLALVDQDGVSYREALNAYGKDARDISAAALPREESAAYVEVHIEQGPILESENEPLGVVTGIAGMTRLKVTVTGEAGHAGTVPMTRRHDALLAAAEMALAVEGIAKDYAQDNMVTTVGRLDVAPGAVNIIPGRVVFTVDLRTMNDAARHAAVARFDSEARRIAAARGASVNVDPFVDEPATPCDPAVREGLAGAITALGYRPLAMPSGAGHDAQMMARLCPSAMLFVRCKDGISHNPAEYTSPRDMGLAVAAVINFIENFKPA